jgi:hypothetical protein
MYHSTKQRKEKRKKEREERNKGGRKNHSLI